jgi:ABC-type nitrate/sulfonate/bicarbonate transport system substrate-binding protein
MQEGSQVIRIIRSFAWVVLLAAVAAVANAQQGSDKVRTFSQTNYPGFIQYIARELGLFAKYGIDSDLRFFPSGAPIVQAAAAKEWDMAFLGAPPAVIGASSLGMVTIGVIYDEAPQHKLIGRPDYVAKALADPASLKGAKIFVTTLSTGHYMTEACLRKFGLTPKDAPIIPSEQAATLTAFTAGRGDLAQVWPPFTSTLLERGNKVLCDGGQAGIDIATVWVTTKDFAAKHPDLVVKWLRANGKAVKWVKQDLARTLEMYRKFMEFNGQTSTEAVLKDVVAFVMTANTLEDQLRYLTPANGQP